MKLRLLLTAFIAAASFAVSAQSTVTATEAHVVIDGSTTREQLAQLRSDMMQQGIDFQYKPVFDSAKKLTAISFKVTANQATIQGSGDHQTLQNPGASIVFDLNKSTNSITINGTGDLSKK